MPSTLVYSVFTGREDKPKYFRVIGEANLYAKELADKYGEPVEIEQSITLDRPLRELVARFLNGDLWCKSSRVVQIVHGTKSGRRKKK